MRSPLGSALGLGAAKEGPGHWWSQRVTAVALVPLALWLMYSLFTLASLARADALIWMQSPFNAVLLLLFLISMFYHSFLGLQVVIEDYMHTELLRISTLIIVQFAHLLLAALSVFAVLKMALGGAAP